MKHMNKIKTGLVALAILALAACESGAGQTKAETTEPTPNAASATAEKKAAAEAGAKKEEAKKAPARKDGNFTIKTSSGDLVAGTAGEFGIDVKPKPGYKINKDFPWKAKIVAGDNFTVDAEVGKDKWTLDDKGASLKAPITAKAAGDGEVKAKVSFSVCNDTACDVIRDHEVVVKVAAK